MAHVGAPLPCTVPPPTRVSRHLLLRSQTSQGELSIRLRAPLGTQAGGWRRYRVSACTRVQVCVRIKVCVCTSVHT